MKPNDVAEAGRVLRTYVVDFEVDPRLLERLLADHLDLVGKATTWGWDDTEVREQLSSIVSQAH